MPEIENQPSNSEIIASFRTLIIKNSENSIKIIGSSSEILFQIRGINGKKLFMKVYNSFYDEIIFFNAEGSDITLSGSLGRVIFVFFSSTTTQSVPQSNILFEDVSFINGLYFNRMYSNIHFHNNVKIFYLAAENSSLNIIPSSNEISAEIGIMIIRNWLNISSNDSSFTINVENPPKVFFLPPVELNIQNCSFKGIISMRNGVAFKFDDSTIKAKVDFDPGDYKTGIEIFKGDNNKYDIEAIPEIPVGITPKIEIRGSKCLIEFEQTKKNNYICISDEAKKCSNETFVNYGNMSEFLGESDLGGFVMAVIESHVEEEIDMDLVYERVKDSKGIYEWHFQRGNYLVSEVFKPKKFSLRDSKVRSKRKFALESDNIYIFKSTIINITAKETAEVHVYYFGEETFEQSPESLRNLYIHLEKGFDYGFSITSINSYGCYVFYKNDEKHLYFFPNNTVVFEDGTFTLSTFPDKIQIRNANITLKYKQLSRIIHSDIDAINSNIVLEQEDSTISDYPPIKLQNSTITTNFVNQKINSDVVLDSDFPYKDKSIYLNKITRIISSGNYVNHKMQKAIVEKAYYVKLGMRERLEINGYGKHVEVHNSYFSEEYRPEIHLNFSFLEPTMVNIIGFEGRVGPKVIIEGIEDAANGELDWMGNISAVFFCTDFIIKDVVFEINNVKPGDYEIGLLEAQKCAEIRRSALNGVSDEGYKYPIASWTIFPIFSIFIIVISISIILFFIISDIKTNRTEDAALSHL